MLKLDPIRQELPEKKEILTGIGESLGLSDIREKAEILNQETMKEGFWDDPETAQKVLKQKSSLENKISSYETLDKGLSDVEELMELAEEMEDEEEADSVIGMVSTTITVRLSLCMQVPAEWRLWTGQRCF